MKSTVTMAWEILDRMERAVAKVRERLLRATSVLNKAGIPYAVVGGHAVASWVATVDEGAVRNTRDIDLLIRREDLSALTAALEQAGFVRAEVLDVTMFLDGPAAKPSESIHLLFAGEKVRAEDPLPSPDLAAIDDPAGFRVLTLEALVHMKLLSNRDKDRTHLRDLIGVGLIDRSWLAQLPPLLAERLEKILDTPDG
ncbi:MAG: nucleotidyltransferase family protein [Planctomycetes bacterium]|nr:nucleotidyltransferase family protein [Planctomycetota bacterium]